MDRVVPFGVAETEVVRAVYAAINRGDVSALAELFDREIERVEPPGSPESQTFRGIDAVLAHVAKARGNWAEGACEPVRLLVAPGGDRVVALVDVRVRLKDEVAWREGRTADVFAIRNGKVVQFRTYLDEGRALDWAGMKVGGGVSSDCGVEDSMAEESAVKVGLLRAAYAAFNARDIDAALATMASDVRWPMAFKGGFVVGHEAVRGYWTQQWSEIDPRVEPVSFAMQGDGSILVDVRQVVRDRSGAVLADERVGHRFVFEGGLIRGMEVCPRS